MAFRDAFIIRRQVVVAAPAGEKGEAKAAAANVPAPPPSGQGVFLSAQSLVSFPIATGVVSIVWKLYQHFLPASKDIVVLWISLVVGLLIFLISISDAGARPKEFLSWLIAGGIAIVNSLFLAASSLGLVTGVFGH